MCRFLFPTLTNDTSKWSIDLEVTTSEQRYTDFQRQDHLKKLYQNFSVSTGLSYACSASEYSQYITNSSSNEKFIVTLKKIQVSYYIHVIMDIKLLLGPTIFC